MATDIYTESTKNQLNELKKKLQPIQQIILSFRPRQKPSFGYYIPDFGDEEDVQTNDSDDDGGGGGGGVKPNAETYDTDGQQPLSDKLYQIFDQSSIQTISCRLLIKILFLQFLDQASSTIANRCPLMTYKITSYLFVFVLLITHRISFTKP